MSEQSDDVVAKADREIAFYQSDPQAAAKLGWPVNLLSELRDEVLRLRDLSNHNFEAAMQLQQDIRSRDEISDRLIEMDAQHRSEIARLTELLIDARVAHINTVMALRNYQSYPPDERHICAGMTPEDFAAYLVDPRGFVRQQIKDGK